MEAEVAAWLVVRFGAVAIPARNKRFAPEQTLPEMFADRMSPQQPEELTIRAGQ